MYILNLLSITLSLLLLSSSTASPTRQRNNNNNLQLRQTPPYSPNPITARNALPAPDAGSADDVTEIPLIDPDTDVCRCHLCYFNNPSDDGLEVCADVCEEAIFPPFGDYLVCDLVEKENEGESEEDALRLAAADRPGSAGQ